MEYKYKCSDGSDLVVTEHRGVKLCKSPDYNYTFDKNTGFFARWGRRLEDDPLFCDVGPEILDIEISVNGCPNGCAFCYKNNTSGPAKNMSLETFKTIIDKIPKTLTQVAFGITGVQTNPDFLAMMAYCRSIGIIPNFTLSGIDLTDDMAKSIADLTGALAVSAYKTDKNICYNTVKKFTNLGIKQTNIHVMVSAETYDFVHEVIEDRKNDERLRDMNAIVFLGLKPKGRASNGFNTLTHDKFSNIITACLDSKIPFGFDSCSAPKFIKWVTQSELPHDAKQNLIMCAEPCESSLFSAYINVDGKYWHCSFSEDEVGQDPVDVLTAKDFQRDVWHSPQVLAFREKVLAARSAMHCPVYKEI